MAYKLLTHETSDGPRAAILVGDRVFDAAAVSGRPDYSTALGVLNDWAAADQLFASVSGEGRAKKGGSAPERGIAPEGGIALEGGGIAPAGGIALEGVKLLAPILYPGQIFAAGANYEDHIAEMGKSEFKAQNARKAGGRPWHFGKSSRSAVIGHGSIRPLPPYSRKVDWEIELAVVIGREATRIPAGRALEYVAGYTIANDLSARDFVVRDGIEANSPFRFDWISHKGFDGACPLGPWITPARDIPDPQSLALKLWVAQSGRSDPDRHAVGRRHGSKPFFEAGAAAATVDREHRGAAPRIRIVPRASSFANPGAGRKRAPGGKY